jgi:hypothetical protein
MMERRGLPLGQSGVKTASEKRKRYQCRILQPETRKKGPVFPISPRSNRSDENFA